MNLVARTFLAALSAALLLTLAEPSLPAAPPVTLAPAGPLKVWTSDLVSNDKSPTTARELKPILLVGARNGTFSGRLVVESGSAIKGVRAAVSALTGKGGTIAATNLQVRYAANWESHGWMLPGPGDILLDSSPEAVPEGRSARAVLPVWVTVRVPKDAKAGLYTGEVTVRPEGAETVRVPLRLDVQDWTLPEPQDYRTFLDFMESPDTLAVEYKVPLWSDKHWKLIDRSFQLLSPTGGRVVYVPLICHTNLGNEQSMVRWIPRGEGRYDYDFTVLDKYLDSAAKNLGQPKLVIFQVWDICMSLNSLNRGLWGGETETRKDREELLGKGPRVTALDPATKAATLLTLPRYEEPVSKDLWKPLFAELRRHLAQRGLTDGNMMLGLMCDIWPGRDEVAFWKEVSGDLPWVIHGHAGRASDVDLDKKGLYGISSIGYAAFVYNLVFNVNPEKGRLYGWHNKALLSCFWRNGALNMASLLDVREFPGFNITGGQRGGGRMGADFWPVLRNKKGDRSGAVWLRYPENNWRNLDAKDWFLAPGPDGAVATARLESLKEGVQECEARIVLEDALLDADKKAKLGPDLAQRCQKTLDEHQRAMWKSIWTNDADLDRLGIIAEGRNPQEGLMRALGKGVPASPADEIRKGHEWFAQGWLDRNRKLFALAGEVAAKLNPTTKTWAPTP